MGALASGRRLTRASSVCGCDAAPGDDGLWILAVQITSSTMEDLERWLTGKLVGFEVVHDFDDDGKYESLVHLWTAKNTRRQGVATQLVAEARRRFPLTVAEAPFTEEALALLAKCWPEALAKQDRTAVSPGCESGAEEVFDNSHSIHDPKMNP